MVEASENSGNIELILENLGMVIGRSTNCRRLEETRL
jgi:hypothetical protein